MAQTTEGHFVTRDGTKLYTKSWTPSEPSDICLIFIHGFSDHINAYYDLFPTLSSPRYNIQVHGFDQRGWGQSVSNKSERGKTGDTSLVLGDIHDFICHVQKLTTNSNVKFFLMGHSMGGAESLTYMLANPTLYQPSNATAISKLAGVLVESPHIGFPPETQPSGFTVFAGRLAGRLLPNMQMVQRLPSDKMSRNPQVCKDWENDPLCHDTGTLQGLSGLLDRASALKTLGEGQHSSLHLSQDIPYPVWISHGDGDQVCDYQSSKKLFETLMKANSGSASAEESKFVDYAGGYHKLHAEPEGMGEQFARDAGDWMIKVAKATRVPTSSGSASTSLQANAGTPDANTEDVKARL